MSANLTRLKKRIETLEQWVEDNEAIAGPEGTLDTVNYLISKNRQADQMQAHLNQLQGYLQEYLNKTESMDQWNEFIQTREQENAVQNQQTEKVSEQKEAESSEEAIKAPEEKE
jgi:tRNA-dihydrouridine synthase